MALAQPFITIIGSYFFVFLFAFGIPVLMLIGIAHFWELGILPETIAFLVMAGGAILCTNFYSLTQWMIKRTPLRNMGNHKYEGYRERLAFAKGDMTKIVCLIKSGQPYREDYEDFKEEVNEKDIIRVYKSY